MSYFTEEKGDATEALQSVKTGIVHCVNNAGLWGSGFVIPLGIKYPKARDHYKANFKYYSLGQVQAVKITDDLVIYNLFGQDGVKSSSNPTPIVHDKFYSGLEAIYKAVTNDTVLLMPAIGSDRAGGNWKEIKQKIKDLAEKYRIKTVVRYL